MPHAKYGLKGCIKCGHVKVVEDFRTSKQTKDGFQPYCRECSNAYNVSRRQTNVAARLSSLYYNAKSRGEVSITLDWLVERYTGYCEYTGAAFDLKSVDDESYRNPMSPSLDQIVPKRGYHADNVAIVCNWVNCAKGEMSYDSWKEKTLAAAIHLQNEA